MRGWGGGRVRWAACLPARVAATRLLNLLNQTPQLSLITEESVEIKCQLDATEVFIADLIACSTCFGHHYAHHQELKSFIQWLLPVVFGAVILTVHRL